MSVHERTKQLIVEAFRELVRMRRPKDVRVNDICEKCGISRRTFYYHFQDKYDLLAWIIQQEFRSNEPEPAFTSLRSREMAFRAIKENIPFYKSVYSDPGISELSEYLAYYDTKYYIEFAEAVLGKGAITEDQIFSLRLFVYGGIYMSRRWVMDGCQTDPGVIAGQMGASMPSWLADLVTDEQAETNCCKAR